jgi:hypothetical protein
MNSAHFMVLVKDIPLATVEAILDALDEARRLAVAACVNR